MFVQNKTCNDLNKMKDNKKRNWYPLSSLPMFTCQIDQLIEVLENKYSSFLRTKDSPELLNDNLVSRAIDIFKKNSEFVLLYQEQLDKWREEIYNNTQKQALYIFAQKIVQARNLNAKLLDLSKQLKQNTINRILKQDDMKLALDSLSEKRIQRTDVTRIC